MGILGTTFGRALAGAGESAVRLTNRYIDQELAMQRDQALADLQHSQAVRTEEYQQSAPVQARRNENAAAGSLAQAAAARRAKTEGMADTGYQGALDAEADAETGRKVRAANQVLEGTTDAEVKRNNIIGAAKTDEDIRRATAMLPLEVKKAYAVADAAGRASARNREAPGADLEAKLSIMEKRLKRPLSEMEALGVFGLAGKAPDAGTVQEETEYGPDGAPMGRKVTEKRPLMPGATTGGGAASEEAKMRAALEAIRAARQGNGGAKPQPRQATAAPAEAQDPIAIMDERTLRRLAAIPGHVNQAKAKAELQRRENDRPEVDATGYGFGVP